MTYASANRRPNPAALVGALGIPGAFGALLVVGLAVTVATTPPEPRLKGEHIDEIPLPPPPPPVDKPHADTKSTNPTTVPTTPINPVPPINPPIIFDGPVTFPTTPAGTDGPIVTGTPGTAPSPASLYDPVGARPKGDRGRWVTNDDYRSRWIMEDMSGRAAFTLAIDARGKVTECTITRSTGHAPLDAATCDLVSKRARFDAARDGNGKAVPGSYSGSVTWQIPK